MQHRGHLIRHTLPDQLRELRPSLAAAMGDFGDDADAQGKDNMGRMAHIPWVRWFSKSRSPRATKGWYLVYLFHADGSGVSLCLSHGSTEMKGGSFVQRSGSEVAKIVSWGWNIVSADFSGDDSIQPSVHLGKLGLGPAYQRTTLFSKFYPAKSIPSDQVLQADLVRFARSLAKLYDAREREGEPGSPSPEAVALEAFISPLGRSSKGQGRGLSAAARKAVETAAMLRARKWLKEHGFRSRDVSAHDCCDFRAKRNGEEWVIEVKGTTGRARSVLLTRNEVDLHRTCHPRNILLIVHSLRLTADGTKAEGGELVVHFPWEMQESQLSPVGFEYRFD